MSASTAFDHKLQAINCTDPRLPQFEVVAFMRPAVDALRIDEQPSWDRFARRAGDRSLSDKLIDERRREAAARDASDAG